jgi:hypothetical protein
LDHYLTKRLDLSHYPDEFVEFQDSSNKLNTELLAVECEWKRGLDARSTP